MVVLEFQGQGGQMVCVSQQKNSDLGPLSSTLATEIFFPLRQLLYELQAVLELRHSCPPQHGWSPNGWVTTSQIPLQSLAPSVSISAEKSRTETPLPS